MMGTLAAVFFLLLFVGAVLVAHGTVAKNRWGVNIEGLKRGPQCPRCAAAMPRARVPKTFAQALWGGNACPMCGCDVDKWGREVKPDFRRGGQ